ncbi:cathepsin O-like isoform X2 [Branchiostoma floridae]|uniref:Cathepsin O-like isoform X1 n=1 Tax=Branchiostoma floridae TaxID=7739 RepID=A0A9J7LFC7_BRAFL|nr:cathepsin O-like isoform X1 [Branchiostoma floridae]XP_035681773.1 cathepsin O-like isoform X2 [Branchiostoma floridae]
MVQSKMAVLPTRKLKTDKLFLLSLSFLALVALATTSDVRQLFEDFVVKFGKKYQSKEEYWRRYHIFKESVLRHQQMNLGRTAGSALYGVNRFSDLTPAEFREKHLSTIKTDGRLHTSNVTGKNSAQSIYDPHYSFEVPSDVPPIWDWRKNKTVTAIRDQGSCGGCWAFSIVETIESQWSIAGHPLEEYSVQQVLDCDRTKGSHGCRGGDTCNALSWMNQTTANLVPKKDYPYTGKDGECRFFTNTTDSVHLTNYTCRGYENHEDEMVRLLHGHSTLAIIVDATSWQDYLGGIIQHHCSHDYNNHAVQIVGYNIKGDVPYFIVRNSWGSSWGLDGYLHIRIGSNLCGVANQVSTVSV